MKKIFRNSLIVITFLVLFLSLNFTAIIAFIFIILLIEYNLLEILFLRARRRNLKNLIFVLLLISSILSVSIFYFSMNLFSISNHLLLLFGGNSEGSKYIDITIRDISKYISFIREYPLTTIIGEGFSSFGIRSGGDTGFIESLANFGWPFFSLIVFYFFRKIFNYFRLILQRPFHKNVKIISLMGFAVSIFLTTIIFELHYSIWISDLFANPVYVLCIIRQARKLLKN